MDRKGFDGEAGQIRSLAAGKEDRIPQLVIVGLGKAEKVTSEILRHAAGAGVRAARDHGARHVTIVPPD